MYILIEMLKMKNMYERISHVELTFVFIFVRTKIYGQIVQFYITARSNPFFPLFHERSIEHARDVHIKFIVASYSTVSDVVLDDSCVDRTGNVSLFDYQER